MKLVVNMEVQPNDDSVVITSEQVRLWLQGYALAPDISYEMSLSDDPWDMETGGPYVKFTIPFVLVELVPE